MPFRKVLVANRGEIAVRIVRACRDLGIPTAVAHSDVDADSLAVRLADDAICVGPGPAARSYLNVPALLYACAKTGADAIHPGYGFLSEDADFAEACRSVGVTFIGPAPQAIRLMGDKIGARSAMAAAGVPVFPGSPGPVTDARSAADFAGAVGYPVVLKAAAGGGGRGLRQVNAAAEMATALPQLRDTARSLFFDERVYLEKFVPAARHVEVQILADGSGNVVHLGERDCSIQRRHQKLAEESPSTQLSAAMRAELCEAAVRGAASIGYQGAGTMEFLLDQEGDFAFLEMNTRVQVEHPVTELRTGVDIVRWSILLAAGEKLDFDQTGIACTGHALECRINTEDPARQWQGSSGRLDAFQPPNGSWVRVDTHGFPGYFIPPHYDSLLAKVIVVGATRDETLVRMRRALAEFEVTGVRTTLPFHRQLMDHPEFVAGTHRLDFVDRFLTPEGVLRVSDG
ncbi:acetyl-CoA carboxylase biotin carboxylase subunit [Streptomyces gobiensis]|uniref:acetyl-CoA carboxylase biotin carboxylase subunit n=1 Tax=Streptomyces gobiensis TaxID=2875706 RepID=UPI001E5ED9F1|nr:acetyl-CoA carboxylase biotin carboxylase subunit [Streptomyces gobiensis]UGY94214.1 acetyl-CoA carboxylase biotin carboxylase subunit [Streptomyces gobiensis]